MESTISISPNVRKFLEGIKGLFINGSYALENYMEVKSVWVDLN